MYNYIFLISILLITYYMVIVKRLPALVGGFRLQSLFLFLTTVSFAFELKEAALYIVAILIFVLKVILIPNFLAGITKKIQVNENLGLLLNPQLSILVALILTYLSYLFTFNVMPFTDKMQSVTFALTLCVILIGLFIMIFRLKAITQIIGLLVMENGLFLLAVTMCRGMPFLVEISIFLDVFISVIILGIFVYRINTLFTHIDVNKLTNLRG
ncbi:MAG: hydrogenase [Candidatus Omnitrophica bacterium]|nr:hydrogenase [Candidatus Omnitrophota bacterium]